MDQTMNSGNSTRAIALAGILLLTCSANSEQVGMEAETGGPSKADTGRALCELLDLDRPGLALVRNLSDRGDYSGVLVAYRDRLVDLVSTLDMGEPPGYWLWGPTEAKDLLNDGEVATFQYGEFSRVTRYTLGPPGAVDWNKIPEDGYDVVLRDLPTMHWTGKLIEAYRENHDPAYLKAYLGYWDDFARNWPPAHEQLLRDEVLIRWDSQPHVQKSIFWASASKLYYGWHMENLSSWLAEGIRASPEQAKETLDPLQLAIIVLHLARFEVPGAIRGLEEVETPNQFVLCAMGLLQVSLVLQEMKQAPAWTETAISKMEWYLNSSGYLEDGSDLEQSFNYNAALVPSLDSILKLAHSNPPLKGREFPWRDQFQTARDYRERFLDSVVMPNGCPPSTGCNNAWSYSRDEAVAAYTMAKGTLPPLRERISNHLLGDGSISEPLFTSIYFPYGGWVVLRDGWAPTSLYAFMKTSRPAAGHMREGGNGLALVGYGRDLLVNSGTDGYSDRGVYNRYFDSTVSQSSISVDGFSQVLNATESEQRYDEPIPARWYTSSHFDVSEGIFDSGYGGWNFRTGAVEGPLIDDVRHERQVIFLREVGVWIVTDRLMSSETHDYTQSWCFGPEFESNRIAVGPAGRPVLTEATTGPNVELYFSSMVGLALEKHHGEKSDKTALGWRAFDWDENQRRYAPGVDVLVEWKGEGNQLAVTLIVPSHALPNRVMDYLDLSIDGTAGFSALMANGNRVTYLASEGGSLKTEEIEVEGEALLTVVNPSGETSGVVLGPNGADSYEFALNATDQLQEVADIRVPRGFRWTGKDGSHLPDYN